MQSKEKAWDQMLLATEEVPNVKGNLGPWHKICYRCGFSEVCSNVSPFICI